MAGELINLNPGPSIYPNNSLSLTGTKDPEVQSIIYTTNGDSPTLAKYIAYDTLNPPNPFIATVQDGRGNVIFDGGFPKWYDIYWNSASSFSALNASCKYLYNGIKFIANKEKEANGNKKILVLGDADSGAGYNIMQGGSHNFHNTLSGVGSLAGYDLVFKTRSSYGSVLDPSYTELDQYVACIFFSTVYTDSQLITDTAISNFGAFREAGNGIFFITDHGTGHGPGTTGFYSTANYVMTQFGAYFEGNFTRSPVNVGFLRANYGDHPLYNNLDDSEYIHAGGSESKVFVTEYTKYTSPPNITISGEGYHNVRFLLQLQNGEIITESYTYGLQVPELVDFKDYTGTVISDPEPTLLNHYRLNFTLNHDTYPVISGLIKNGDVVKGTFSSNSFQNGIASVSWLEGNDNIFLNDGNKVTVQVQTPFSYFKNIDSGRVYVPRNGVSLARNIQSLNQLELHGNPFKLLSNSDNNLIFPSTVSLPFKLNKLYNTLTDNVDV